MRAALAIATVVLLPLAQVSYAQDNFTLERGENGYIRLDNATGRTSICEERGRQLVCRAAVEERQASEDEIARLQERIGQLERRITALEQGAPALKAPGLPSEEEFEKTLGFMERFFRRFMDMVRDFEKENTGDGPAADGHRT